MLANKPKELAHVPKQLRLLKGDKKFFKKIARTANEDHLLACVIAEAMRVGILAGAVNPSASSKKTPRVNGKENGNRYSTLGLHWDNGNYNRNYYNGVI